MWTRRWPGRKPQHSAWQVAKRLVEAVRLDSEPGARMAAFARHTETPARQRQTERTPLDNASSQFADDSYLMHMRNTTVDQPVLERRSTWRDSNEAGGNHAMPRALTSRSNKLSSPAESHRQALPAPDVNLSIHPAPIVQPLTPHPNARTGSVDERALGATKPRLAWDDPGVVCMCAWPNTRGSHPACTVRDEGSRDGSARRTEPNQ
jgi:hypothetical protein